MMIDGDDDDDDDDDDAAAADDDDDILMMMMTMMMMMMIYKRLSPWVLRSQARLRKSRKAAAAARSCRATAEASSVAKARSPSDPPSSRLTGIQAEYAKQLNNGLTEHSTNDDNDNDKGNGI